MLGIVSKMVSEYDRQAMTILETTFQKHCNHQSSKVLRFTGHSYLRVNLYSCLGRPKIFAPSYLVVHGHFHAVS